VREAKVLEVRRAKPYWGARRLALELTRKGGAEPPLSESAVYRCLVRAGVIEPQPRRRRREIWETLGALQPQVDGTFRASPPLGHFLHVEATVFAHLSTPIEWTRRRRRLRRAKDLDADDHGVME
jgi:hypothetical protein